MRGKIISLGCILLFFSLSAFPQAGAEKQETVDRTIEVDVSRPLEFEFTDNDGDVRFSTWNRSEVRINVRKEVRSVNGSRAESLLRDTKVDIAHSRNSIRVHIRYPRVKGFFVFTNAYRVKVTSEITLPADSNLTCRLDDGDIVIEGVQGEFDLRTDDGTIQVLSSKGSLDAGSDDGRIILENFSGQARLDSDDGDLLLSGTFGQLDLESDDGDITVKALEDGAVKNDWSLETDDGDVNVSLPEHFSADVRIDSDDGSIDNFLPIVFQKLSSETNVAGRLNEGGRIISIRTDDGDITLRELR